MSILSIIISYQGPLLLLAAILGPSLLPRVLNIINRRNLPQHPVNRRANVQLTRTTIVFVFLHTIYCLYLLAIPPYDIFISHRFPILIPNDVLRSTVLAQAHNLSPRHSNTDLISPELPNALLDLLLSRISTLEPRFLYSRFGHIPLLTCVWCSSKEDFFIASIPHVLAPYLAEALFLGVLSWSRVGGVDAGRRARTWRSSLGWVLGIATAAELGIKYFWELRVESGDCLHLAPMIQTYRTVLLTLLPIIYLFLPIPEPPTSAKLAPLLPHLHNALSTLRLTSTSRTAINRSPTLREIWTVNGRIQADISRAGREDDDVQRKARDLGLVGKEVIGVLDVREQAGRWIREGWRGMIRIGSGNGSRPMGRG